jgi:hypothetical protein
LSSAEVLALELVRRGSALSCAAELAAVMLERNAEGAVVTLAAVLVAGLSAVAPFAVGVVVEGATARAVAPAVGRAAPVSFAPVEAAGFDAVAAVGRGLAVGLLTLVGSALPAGLETAVGRLVPVGLLGGVVGFGALVGSALPVGFAGRGAAGATGATDAPLAGSTEGESAAVEPSSVSSPVPTASPRTSMMCSHFLHLNFVTSRPRSFSSAT